MLIDPPPARVRTWPGSAARIRRNGDSTMSRRISRNASGSNSVIGLIRWMPALLTRMSTSSVRSSSAAVSARSTTHASPPTSAAASAAASAFRSAMITCAPRRANSCAHARPMPLAPPVTSARLPAQILLGQDGSLLVERPKPPQQRVIARRLSFMTLAECIRLVGRADPGGARALRRAARRSPARAPRSCRRRHRGSGPPLPGPPPQPRGFAWRSGARRQQPLPPTSPPIAPIHPGTTMPSIAVSPVSE